MPFYQFSHYPSKTEWRIFRLIFVDTFAFGQKILYIRMQGVQPILDGFKKSTREIEYAII